MVIVCSSLHWHHVDHLTAPVNCTLIAVHMLKLHQEYYYTYYFSIVLPHFEEVPYILVSWYHSIVCSNHASSHQKVYAHVGECIFLFHVHASTEQLLGLVGEGNSHWGHEVFSVTSSLVSHNNLDLGWNTAADLWDSLCNSIDYLINQANVGCIPF